MKTGIKYLLRFGLATIMLLGVVGKWLDFPAAIEVLRQYHLFLPSLLQPLAIFLFVAEIMLGLWLLSGCWLMEAAWFVMLWHGVLAVAVIQAKLRHLPLLHIGYFGSLWPQLPSKTLFVMIVVMLVSGWLLYRLSRKP